MQVGSLKDRVLAAIQSDIPKIFSSKIERATRSGNQINGCCPFHDDNNPSFSANVEKGLWKCHSSRCGATGDIFEFIRRVRGFKDFKQTLQNLAREYKVILQKRSCGSTASIQILKAASEDFHRRLMNDNSLVTQLCRLRGLSLDTLKHYKIGWNPPNGRKYPFKPGCYTIPIRDAKGQVINIRLYNAKASGAKMVNTSGFGSAALFGLDELVKSDESDWIIITEGEWDKLVLSQHGFLSITGTAGASTWKKEWTPHFKDRKVVICYDCDEAGKKGAARAANAVVNVASEVRVITLPLDGTKGSKDVSDYFRSGGTESGFKALIDSAQIHEKNSLHSHSSERIGPDGFPITDLGNAQRLVASYGSEIRYCTDWNRWLVWDGRRWIKDDNISSRVMQYAKKSIIALYEHAKNITDWEELADYLKTLSRFESKPRLKAMVELAQTEPGMPITAQELDKDKWLLNCLNGTIDLRLGKLRPHRCEDLITKLVPVEYDPDASAPTWDAFLDRIMAGTKELITFLKLIVGYSLTGETNEQCFFILCGTGANGKSTFLQAISRMLADYARKTPTDTLLAKKDQGGPSNDLARLCGARFVTAEETDIGRRIAESLIKQLTGGDTMTARFLYSEHFEFEPTFKLFLATNHRPLIKGADYAIWRRVKLIPFDVTIPENERDRDLPGKLQQELPGILKWAVDGCLEWQKIGLKTPEKVDSATQDYRAEMDVLGDFLRDCCVKAPHAWVFFKDLYQVYEEWCGRNGERPVTKRTLGCQLRDRGFIKDQGTHGANKGQVRWRGLGLIDGPYAVDEPRVDKGVGEVGEVGDHSGNSSSNCTWGEIAASLPKGRLPSPTEGRSPTELCELGAKEGVL